MRNQGPLRNAALKEEENENKNEKKQYQRMAIMCWSEEDNTETTLKKVFETLIYPN
jgi:hypothetical protein